MLEYDSGQYVVDVRILTKSMATYRISETYKCS